VTFSFANFNDLLKTCRHLRIDLKGEEEKKEREKNRHKKKEISREIFCGRKGEERVSKQLIKGL
jgi:hypothetical protein